MTYYHENFSPLNSPLPSALLHLPTHRPIEDYSLQTYTMGKVHGSLTNAGRVRAKTPKVPKQEDKPKPLTGRAKKRLLYTRRFINVTLVNGKRRANPGPSTKA